MAKTYTPVSDLGVRSQLTEAIWDAQLRDNINNLIVPPSCRLTKSAATSIASATETAVPFDQETWDTDSMHDTVTNNTRITPTTTGLYVVTANGDMTANATGVRYGGLRPNGTASTYIGMNGQVAASTALSAWHNVSCLHSFNGSTDYMEYVVNQNSGGALNFPANLASCFFSAIWVGKSS